MQAVLYILCFRLRDIAAEACTMEALASIPLQALLRSPLQPLVVRGVVQLPAPSLVLLALGQDMRMQRDGCC